MQAQKKPSEALRLEQAAGGEPPETLETAGWDPYEVWRTRILLPRQAAAAKQAVDAPGAGVQVRLVHASSARGAARSSPREAPATPRRRR